MENINIINNLKSYNNIIEKRPNNYFLVYITSKRCQDTNTIFSELTNDINETNNLIFIKIDVDQSPELVKYLDITTYPIFRIYKNNQNLKEICSTYTNIRNILQNVISIC